MRNSLKIFVIIFILAVFCACSQTEIPEENPVLENEKTGTETAETSWENITDLSGEKINSNDVISFKVDYAVCWNLLSDEYKKLDSNKKWLGYSVNASSVFSVTGYTNDFAVCSQSELSLYLESGEEAKGFSGIFVFEEDIYGNKELLFYPYYDEENAGAFVFLQGRNEYSENKLKEKEVLLFADGTEKKVQPIGITCRYYDTEWKLTNITNREQLEDFSGTDIAEEFDYIEATVYFDSFAFIGSSEASDVPVQKTTAFGTVSKIEFN